VIPPDWKKQPLDNGGRFLSPDGSASFAFYTTAGHDEPITEHMKSFAFGDGEEITSLAGERTWITASGFKGDRLFYRQAALACGGDRWHHCRLCRSDITSSTRVAPINHQSSKLIVPI
jgi:hypothetical protein